MRKLLYIFAGLTLVFLLAVLAIPLWLPWVVKPVGAKFGLEYGEYERIGYGRFALHDLSFEHEAVTVSGGRLEAYLPLSWIFHALRMNDDAADFLVVEDWRVVIDPPEKVEVEEPEDVFAYRIFEQVEGVLPYAVRWAPRVTLQDGVVAAKDFEATVEEVRWDRGRLDGRAGTEFAGEVYEVVLRGDVSERGRVEVEAELLPFEVVLSADAVRADEELALTAQVSWLDNRIDLSALFGPDDVLPTEARLSSSPLSVPSEKLGLDEYEALAGLIRAEWRESGYELSLWAEAVPRDPESPFSRIELDVRAQGDLEKVRLEALTLNAPFLRAELSEPLVADYRGRLLGDESIFFVEGDLAEQGFFEASGSFDVWLNVSPGPADWPDLAFELNAEALSAFEVTGESVTAEGRVFWPGNAGEEEGAGFSWPHADFEVNVGRIEAFERVLEQAGARGRFTPPVAELNALTASLADGTSLEGFIDFDVVERRVGQGELVLNLREEVVRSFLPEGVGFDRARLAARVSGPLEAIEHEVEFTLDSLRAPEIRPGNLAFSWHGEFLHFDQWSLEWRNVDDASIEAGGALRGALDRAELDLRRLVFASGEETLLALEAPVLLELSESESPPDPDLETALQEWRVILNDLVLEGPAERLALNGLLDWPRQGELDVTVEGFRPALFEHYLTRELPDFYLERFGFESFWDDGGALTFNLDTRAEVELPGVERLRFVATASGDESGIRVERLTVSEGEASVLTATGRFPVSVFPGRMHEPLVIDYESEIRLEAASDPDATVWERLDAMAGIRLEAPRLRAELEGTLLQPRGVLAFSAESLEYTGLDDQPLPDLREIDLRAVFDVDEARLEIFRFLVEGQEVRAEAVFPLGGETLTALISEGRVPDWQRIEAALLIDRAEIAPFARFFPGLLSPQGTLTVDLAIKGDRFERGELILEGAATRPIMPVGSIQDMRAHMRFEDRGVVLEEFSGRVGGERVRVAGRLSVPDSLEPDFELTVRGDNLPLTRQPGLIIRGDVDLAIRGSKDETPSVTGRINMRESLVITELRAMAPVSVATPQRRPPFFSVDQEPFSEWILDVDIRGDRFLSVRAPGFRGRLSANFNLRGTLIEPQAIGEVQINSGAVRFPFATMRINQGTITLSQDNPYQPQLFITASTRLFGYDLNMELSGTADDPMLEFTSHPPLSSEAILLMITAGELPRDELQFTGQQKATKLALYIAQNLFLEFGGDDDAAERLTIRSGENISEQGRETFYLEYMFWPRVGVVGEYDRFDAFNAGIKWKFYSR